MTHTKRRSRISDKPRQIISEKRDLSRERELLSKPSNAFQGTIVERLMERLSSPDCTGVEAANIGLALQGLIRGDAALINNMNDPKVAETVHNLLEQREKEDAAQRAFEEDQDKFIQGVFDRADKIAPVGEKRDRVIAQGVAQHQDARQMAAAMQTERRLKLAYRIANDPKVEVDVRPEYERRSVNGVVAEVQVKPVIRIMDKSFALNPGKVMLPKILADLYLERRRVMDENAERKMVLSKQAELPGVISAMDRIAKKYNSNQEALPQPMIR